VGLYSNPEVALSGVERHWELMLGYFIGYPDAAIGTIGSLAILRQFCVRIHSCIFPFFCVPVRAVPEPISKGHHEYVCQIWQV
jgi:hypothetical protein